MVLCVAAAAVGAEAVDLSSDVVFMPSASAQQNIEKQLLPVTDRDGSAGREKLKNIKEIIVTITSGTETE